MNEKNNCSFKKTKFPSTCIYITNLGKNCYSGNKEEIIKEFEKVSKIKEFHLGDNSHSFVTFETIQDSIKFYEYYNNSLNNDSILGGRRIRVEFSQSVEKKIKDPSIENHFENQELLSKKGLNIIQDFISNEEALKLMEWFDKKGIWKNKLNRKVQHYGFSFDYSNKIIDQKWELNIPDIIKLLIDRILIQKLLKDPPDQITINNYEIGQGIGPHIDSHHTIGESIAVISIGSSVLLDFYEIKPDKNFSKCRNFKRLNKRTVLIPENSLYIMEGEIRYSWEHGIKSRKTDLIDGYQKERSRRISITFRKYRSEHIQKPCNCNYEEFCDSRSSSLRILPERI